MSRTLAPNRPTVPEVLPLVRALYDSPDGLAGHCWRIVLDDGNVDNSYVEFCVRHIAESGCDKPECVVLVGPMLAMSTTQRWKLYRRKATEAGTRP